MKKEAWRKLGNEELGTKIEGGKQGSNYRGAKRSSALRRKSALMKVYFEEFRTNSKT